MDTTTITRTHKAFSADVKVEEGERAVVARITTTTLDRDGEVLMAQGCNTKDFEKNPVVFWNHTYDMPVGKCTGIKREDGAIVAKTVFAERPANHPADEEWLPDTLFSLYQQGVLKGFSVGAEYTETRQPTKKDMDTFGDTCRRVVSKWKLFEYSAVGLPANQEAVAVAVSKGMLSVKSAAKLGFSVSRDIHEVGEKNGWKVYEGGEWKADMPMDGNAEDQMQMCPKCDAKVMPKDDGTCPECGAMMKAAEPDAVVVTETPRPKRYVYLITGDAPAVPDAASVAAAAMAKAMGRIYYL